MTEFTDKDRAEYYHRCYKAVDGLWFVKTEEKFDFDTSLELDRDVWEVMPKIQARFLKKKACKGCPHFPPAAQRRNRPHEIRRFKTKAQ